jgi:hypothetical protein
VNIMFNLLLFFQLFDMFRLFNIFIAFLYIVISHCRLSNDILTFSLSSFLDITSGVAVIFFVVLFSRTDNDEFYSFAITSRVVLSS